MNVVAFCGSRSPTGQTARALTALTDGLTAEGVLARTVYLPELSIERCRQCDPKGWGRCRSEGRCIIEDDLHTLVEQIRQSDAVVLATPVYFGDLSESLRAFLDRLRRQNVNETGRAGIAGKPAIGVCVAGGGGGGAPRCAESLTWVLQSSHLEVADMIPLRRQNLPHRLAVLEQIGREWARVLSAGQG
jgi:multimeric flavodoxin WrbA